MRCFLLLIVGPVLMSSTADVRATPPEQFQVWGSVAPQAPPVPAGWTELRDPFRALSTLQPTLEEQQRGFVVAACEPLTIVPPYAVPLPQERTEELTLFAARGQYEPATFLIYAVDTLDDVRVAVHDLRSGADHVIPADHLDVRFVRSVRVPVDGKAKTYRAMPFLLEKRQTASVAKSTVLQVWLTVKVPDAAEPGDYAGAIEVQCEDRDKMQLTLHLNVLPFVLPGVPIEMAMYYPSPSASDDMLFKQLVDLREHGCGIEPALGVEIQSRDQVFGDDDVAATQAHCRRLMAAQEKVFGAWGHPVTFEVGHQIAYYWDAQKNWFSHWPHSAKIDQDLLRAVDVIRDLAKAEGWPPLRVYAMDEAGADNLLDEATYYYGLLKKQRPDLITWTDIGGGIAMGVDEIGPLAGIVDILSTNRFAPEIARRSSNARSPTRSTMARDRPPPVLDSSSGSTVTKRGPRDSAVGLSFRKHEPGEERLSPRRRRVCLRRGGRSAAEPDVGGCPRRDR